ncbi:MAG TPA: glycosyltransferase [Candidatus Paceibacterota bacterium]
MKLSIIIPAYNEEAYIQNCLESIQKYGAADSCEVIVVDNGSTDRTGSIASRFPFVTIVSEKKKGNSHARQKGLICAKGELVAFLDADSAISENWLRAAIKEFTSDSDLVALSGPCVFYDIENRYSTLVWIYFNIIVIPFSKINSVVLLGNLVVKKSAIMEIGGFDTNIAFYGDDTNIARRLKKVGKVMLKKDFIIYTSARRLKKEGVVKTGLTYIANYCSEKFFHRQVTKKYLDIR